MIDLTLILSRRYKGNAWTLNGDDYEGLIWHSETIKPSKQELESHWESVKAEVQAEKDAEVAKRSAALAKLEALGLNQDDLKALGL